MELIWCNCHRHNPDNNMSRDRTLGNFEARIDTETQTRRALPAGDTSPRLAEADIDANCDCHVDSNRYHETDRNCDHDTADKDEQVSGGDRDAVPRLQRA